MPRRPAAPNPHYRLYAPSLREPVQDPAAVDFDFGAFLERLLLFDTYVFHSQNLFEIPALADRFGVPALNRLFNSDAVELSVDKAAFGAFSREGEAAAPYTFSLQTFRFEQPNSFEKDLKALRESYPVQRVSDGRALHTALRGAVERLPATFADVEASDRHTSHDFTLAALEPGRLLPFVQAALARHGVVGPRRPVRFDVDADDHVFRVETDIEQVFGLSNEEGQQIAKGALMALGSEVHRVNEMRLFRALSPFAETDVPVFASHLDYLKRLVDPETPAAALSRIVEIKNLPNLRAPGVADSVSLHAVLDARSTPEGAAFREWIWAAADLSDEDIAEQLKYHVQSVGKRFAAFLKMPFGRKLRWLASTGAGVAATAGTAALIPDPTISAVVGNAVAGAIGYGDGFLLDSVIPNGSGASMPAAFVTNQYRGLFDGA